MTLTRKTQIGLLLAALVLFVLLFLAPKTPSVHKTDAEVVNVNDLNKSTIEDYLLKQVNSLKSEDKELYESLIKQASKSTIDTAFISVVKFWDKFKFPDLASFFVEKIANKVQTSDAFLKAGNRYYYSIRFINDTKEVEILYQSAIRCFNKAIEKDANNTDAKIQLASCYVEDGKDPMRGISLLREIEKTDSNNVKLQLSFAFFSVKSGQFDKAIQRFNKILLIDPLFFEVYLHLADVHERQGDKNKTIEMLTKYVSVTDDATAKQEIIKYIQQLKNK